MALPVILINSASGSDSAASGAGPATALTGSAGISAADGLSVILDGSPDLSGVATDGSHVLYFADATAGNRNFVKITGTSGSGGPTATVTVANALGTTLTKAWAIGGNRASLLGTNSVKLLENNSTSGDAMPGWITQLASGHSETGASTVTLRRAGDTTSGYITIQGIAGAATLPLLTFSNNGNAVSCSVARWRLKAFEIRNSNATKTASVAINLGTGCDHFDCRGIRCDASGSKFWKFCTVFANAFAAFFRDNTVGNCASHGWDYTGGTLTLEFENNCIYSCGGSGINASMSSTSAIFRFKGNIFAFNATTGVTWTDTGAATTASQSMLFEGNVFHGNGGDGLASASTSAQTAFFAGLRILDNEFSFNGGYGINFNGSGITDTLLDLWNVTISNNAFYSNTSKYNGFTITSSINEVTTDPSGGLASGTKDYTGATGGTTFMSSVHKALGYPIGGALPVGTYSSSYQYRDIGLQHKDIGSGLFGMDLAHKPQHQAMVAM